MCYVMCYLLVLLSELAVVDVRVLVDDLCNCNNFVVSVLHGHAKERVRVVSRDAVDFVVEPRVLKPSPHFSSSSFFVLYALQYCRTCASKNYAS